MAAYVAEETAQHFVALNRANQTRDVRAKLKAEIWAAGAVHGREVLAAALEDNPPGIATVRVSDVLRWCKSFQPKRYKLTLAYTGCSEFTTVGGLTDRQRPRLCQALRAPDLVTLETLR